MSKIKIIFIVLSLLLITASAARASGYVLPYPSFMPGSKFYRFHQVWEKIQCYWHWGNLGKFKYNLRLSDKYLVESKTLFEYSQHALAVQALGKSNHYFQQTFLFLIKAKEEGKDTNQKRIILVEASEKHKEVLDRLLTELPKVIVWQEEKQTAQRLPVEELLIEAKVIREKI